MKSSLTPQEESVYMELKRLAGGRAFVTGRQLRDAGFARFVTDLYGADVAYPESFQSRKIQILRDKGWLSMNKGTYYLLG